MVSPVTAAGDIDIVHGDDFADADGLALDWIEPSTGWPVLTGATIELTSGGFTKAGTVVDPTGTKKVRVELTAAESATLNQGTGRYTVRATLASGNKITLVQGNFIVRAD